MRVYKLFGIFLPFSVLYGLFYVCLWSVPRAWPPLPFFFMFLVFNPVINLLCIGPSIFLGSHWPWLACPYLIGLPTDPMLMLGMRFVFRLYFLWMLAASRTSQSNGVHIQWLFTLFLGWSHHHICWVSIHDLSWPTLIYTVFCIDETVLPRLLKLVLCIQ